MNADSHGQVLYGFWFGTGSLDDSNYIDARMKTWFGKDVEFDRRIRQEFASWLSRDFAAWENSARDFLSLVILHDQIPRNAFRETARSFAYDSAALALTKEGIRRGYHLSLHVIEAIFLLLPLEHSEVLADQHESQAKFAELHARAPTALQKVTEATLKYAKKHATIIERFGRFPHRNEVLGRASTEEEQEFLLLPGSRF